MPFPHQMTTTPDGRRALQIAELGSTQEELGAGYAGAGGVGPDYSGSVLPTRELISFWRLNEGTGTSAADSKGSNTGTYTGGLTLDQDGATADGDRSVLLDGSTGVITTPVLVVATSGQSKTFEGWAYRNTNTSDDALIGGGLAGVSNNMILYAPAGTNNITFYPNATGTSGTWSSVISAGAWFHWALRYNDATKVSELFINGVSQGTKSHTVAVANNSTQVLWLGANNAASAVNAPFDGRLDDIAVYGRLLTADEVKAHYRAGFRATNSSSSDAGEINAGTITGTTIQTSKDTTAPRLVLTDTELVKYAADGTSRAVVLNATDGLDLLGHTTGSPPDDRALRFLSPSTGASLGKLFSYEVAGQTFISLRADQTTGLAALVSLDVMPPGGSTSTVFQGSISSAGFSRWYVGAGLSTGTVIDSTGKSSFLQLPAAQTTSHHLRVTNSANISIPNNAGTVLTFDTERWDNPNNDQHSTASNTDRLTCVAAGLYEMAAAVAWAANATGQRSVWLQITFAAGGTAIVAVDDRTVVANVAQRQFVAGHYRLAVGDYVQVIAFQTSGAALNITKSANYSPEAWLTWLAP